MPVEIRVEACKVRGHFARVFGDGGELVACGYNKINSAELGTAQKYLNKIPFEGEA